MLLKRNIFHVCSFFCLVLSLRVSFHERRFYRYTKPISGIGIGAQKYNAEVRVSRSDVDSHLVQLSDRLRHVRQVSLFDLHHQLVPHLLLYFSSLF